MSRVVRDGGCLTRAAERLAEVPEVMPSHAITDEFGLIVMVRAHSSPHQLRERMRAPVPAATSRTVVMMSTFYDGRVPPIPPA